MGKIVKFAMKNIANYVMKLAVNVTKFWINFVQLNAEFVKKIIASTVAKNVKIVMKL